MHSLQTRALRASLLAMETSLAATVTIAARMPILLGQMMGQPTGRADESVRMVAEKMEAMAEGALAAQLALWSLWSQMAFGMVRGPSAFAHGVADVAAAAVRPAHRRVKANARRLVRY